MVKKQIKQQVSMFNASISEKIYDDTNKGNFVSYEETVLSHEDELITAFRRDFAKGVITDGERQKILNINLQFKKIENNRLQYTFSCDLEIISQMFGREKIKVNNIEIDCQHSFKDFNLTSDLNDKLNNTMGESGDD